MSTTEILFNSPALHSLKRTQLLQLCKHHNVKATGKNPDIIARLKKHALTLPTDAPLHVAVRSEQPKRDDRTDETSDDVEDDDDENQDRFGTRRTQRPSEMWEVVMEDIPEESGSLRNTSMSMGSIASRGEFGTAASKSSVTSSFKAFASSLGLNRSMMTSSSNQDMHSASASTSGSNASKNKSAIPRSRRKVFSAHNKSDTAPAARKSLLDNAIPYSSIPEPGPSALPQTDPFTMNVDHTFLPFSDRPLPGFVGREGTDDVAGATIRLVMTSALPTPPSPPALQPLYFDQDLCPPTPTGNTAVPRWPMSPSGTGLHIVGGSIYPSLHFEAIQEDNDEDTPMPGGLSPKRSEPMPDEASTSMTNEQKASALLLAPRTEPFIFGSSNPRYSSSNKDFQNAASSVLAEMNARLGLSADESVGLNLLAGRNNDRSDMTEDDVLNYQFGGAGSREKRREVETTKRFEKAHEEEFKKMESIATHYAAKRNRDAPTALAVGKKRKSSVLGSGARRPSALAQAAQGRRRSSTRVISAKARRKMIPGGFGDEDLDGDADEEGADQRRMSKKPRVCEDQEEDGNLDATSGSGQRKVSIAPPQVKDNDDEEKNEEQLRKEREGIKRRLEYNKAKRRSTMGRVSVGGGKAPLVPNQKPKAATSRFGFLNTAKSLVKSVWNRGAGGPSAAAPSAIPQAKATAVTTANTGKVPAKPVQQKHAVTKTAPLNVVKSSGSNTRISTNGQYLKVEKGATSTVSSNASNSRSRSPLPPFDAGSSVRTTATTRTSMTRSRGTSSKGATGNSVKSTGRTSTDVSSIGTRTSVATATSSRVSSLGTKKNSLARASVASRGSTSDTKPRTRPSSTLYAPTASSLARMQQTVRPSTGTNGSISQRMSSGSSSDLKSKSASAVTDHTKRSSVVLEELNNGEGNNNEKGDSHTVKIMTASTPSPSKIPIHVMSPRSKSGAIFSQPLVFPASPVKGGQQSDVVVNPITGVLSPTRKNADEADEPPTTAGPSQEPQKETVRRNISVQRRPRISRSKVIAKLGAQRAAAVSKPRGSSSRLVPGTAKTRSSVGAALASESGGVGRRSHGGARLSGRGDRGIIMSAKKRARQSEYARRRSTRMGEAAVGVGTMDVDSDDDE